MNYLLVMPKKLSKGATTTSVIFPLGIAYISAAMKKAGLAVFTLNLDFPEEEAPAALGKAIHSHQIDVVCTGGLSLDVHKILDVIKAAREVKPNILTIVGGGIISSDPDTAMSVLGADIGVIGEGEQTICELAKALDSGSPIESIPGVIYRATDGQLVTTTPRKEILNLDEIPFPDFDGFNYERWVAFYGGGGVLLSDRSCPFRCTFCFHPTGEKYRQRSLDNIFEEISHQTSRYKVTNLSLTSELFSTTPQRIYDFCERIRPHGISWSCCLRVSDADPELLRTMRDSGCSLVCFGLESGDDSILKSMRKGITVAQIASALDICYDVGISTEASNFIFGDVNETTETVSNTLEFWRKYNAKTHINLSLIQTYPGTVLYEYACKTGIIRDKEMFLKSGCPIINVSKLSSKEYHDLVSQIAEFRLHPHIPAENLTLLSAEDEEHCMLQYTCRRCGGQNIEPCSFWYTKKCSCPKCGSINEVDAFRSATHIEQEFISKLPTDSRIALWGAGGIFYKLYNQYSCLASDRFVLVDSNPELQGLTICSKIVQPPEYINSHAIDTLVITARSRFPEIAQIVRGTHPSVTSLFIPTSRLTPNTITPLLDSVVL